MKILRTRVFLGFIAVILVIMPFFWMKPGEIDIGGDGGRLYFYDPVNLIKHTVSSVFPYAIGKVEASFFNLPFISLLVILKQIIPSGYLLVSVFNGIKIAGGFLAIYAITKELLGKKEGRHIFIADIASIVAGFFYIFSHSMRDNYVLALPTQDQVLLNPLMFYLLLKYMTTLNFRFMMLVIFISFIFSHSFSYGAAPPFFAFYPLAFVFLLIYIKFIRGLQIPWRGITVASLLFIGLHAFHLIPEVFDLFTPGSHINTRVFDKSEIANLIGYFYGVLSIPKVSFYLLAYSVSNKLYAAAVVTPLIIMIGLINNYKKEKTILLTGTWFLIVLFLISAKISNLGIEFYKLLFYIPGYSMFRNFYGQWQFAFYFFYALFFGQALYIFFENIKRRILIVFTSIILVFYFTLSSWNFINGKVINQENSLSKGVKFPVIMDSKYEGVLNFVRSITDDSKILTFPFSDNYFSVLRGTNNGAYVGRSLIGQLTGKKDFSGYTDVAPYSEAFIQSAKKRDYENLKKIIGLLNIKYIFHNTDPGIYDNAFMGAPYSYVRKFFPEDQKGYEEFISHLIKEKVFDSGYYKIYSVDESSYLPHFYTAKEIVLYDNDPKTNTVFDGASAFIKPVDKHNLRTVFVNKETCINNTYLKQICKNMFFEEIPKLQFRKISPVKYELKITQINSPFILVLSDAFHRNWKLFIGNKNLNISSSIKTYFNGDINEAFHTNIFFDKNILETKQLNSIQEENHFIVNAYANAWYILPDSLNNKEQYFVLEMTGHRIFYYAGLISLFTLVVFIVYGLAQLLQIGKPFYKHFLRADKF